jgi:recombination protein RecA
MSKAMRKLNGICSKAKCTLIFINQLRSKIGVSWGNPETTSGGKALKHLYDSRVEIKSGQAIEVPVAGSDKKERIGNEVTLVNRKNKKGVPFRQAVVDFYGTGTFDNRKSLMYAGIKYNIIKFSGKTYEYKDIKSVGKESFMEKLDDKILKEIEGEIWKIQK